MHRLAEIPLRKVEFSSCLSTATWCGPKVIWPLLVSTACENISDSDTNLPRVREMIKSIYSKVITRLCISTWPLIDQRLRTHRTIANATVISWAVFQNVKYNFSKIIGNRTQKISMHSYFKGRSFLNSLANVFWRNWDSRKNTSKRDRNTRPRNQDDTNIQV